MSKKVNLLFPAAGLGVLDCRAGGRGFDSRDRTNTEKWRYSLCPANDETFAWRSSISTFVLNIHWHSIECIFFPELPFLFVKCYSMISCLLEDSLQCLFVFCFISSSEEYVISRFRQWGMSPKALNIASSKTSCEDLAPDTSLFGLWFPQGVMIVATCLVAGSCVS